VNRKLLREKLKNSFSTLVDFKLFPSSINDKYALQVDSFKHSLPNKQFHEINKSIDHQTNSSAANCASSRARFDSDH
jgi:hypothetical protein